MQTYGRVRSMTHGTFDTEGDKPFSIDNTQTKEEAEGNGSNNADVNSKNKSKNIKKQGYFCNSCAEELLQNEFAIKEADSNV